MTLFRHPGRRPGTNLPELPRVFLFSITHDLGSHSSSLKPAHRNDRVEGYRLIPNIQRCMRKLSETCRSRSQVFSNVSQVVSCSGRMFTVRSRKGA
jgi:hypothetical protein